MLLYLFYCCFLFVFTFQKKTLMKRTAEFVINVPRNRIRHFLKRKIPNFETEKSPGQRTGQPACLPACLPTCLTACQRLSCGSLDNTTSIILVYISLSLWISQGFSIHCASISSASFCSNWVSFLSLFVLTPFWGNFFPTALLMVCGMLFMRPGSISC